MKNSSRIVNNLKNKYEIEKNFEAYINKTFSGFSEYAIIKLALERYTVLDMLADDNTIDGSITKLLNGTNVITEIDSIIKEVIISNTESDNIDFVNKANALRNKLISAMEYLQLKVSDLSKVEYVVNRTEYKFKDNFDAHNDVAILNEIMMYLFEDKDNVVINDKLSLIIPEVPIRMTKEKILGRVSDVIGLYSQDTKGALKYFIYNVANNCGINYTTSKGFDISYENAGVNEYLNQKCDKLVNTEFAKLDKEAFLKTTEELSQLTQELTLMIDYIMVVMELINSLLCFVVAGTYSKECNSQSYDVCRRILDLISGENADECFDDKVFELLTKLEGKQEEYGPVNEYLGSQIDDIYESNKEYIEANNFKKAVEDVIVCSKLTSTSVFFTLDVNEEDEEAVNREFSLDIMNKLFEKISEKLIDKERLMKRAYMSAILAVLPNDFANSTQIKEYISNAFAVCTDFAEKEGSMCAIDSVISNEI